MKNSARIRSRPARTQLIVLQNAVTAPGHKLRQTVGIARGLLCGVTVLIFNKSKTKIVGINDRLH